MQTFLTSADPLATFNTTARHLDNKRLNKQALEAWQIMLTNLKLDPQGNHRDPKGWYNHPAARMWRGHEALLLSYISSMHDEWATTRGYKSTILDKARSTLDVARSLGRVDETSAALPTWMTNRDTYERICSTHRRALLCKNYSWYSTFNWPEDNGHAPEPDAYEYVWPL